LLFGTSYIWNFPGKKGRLLDEVLQMNILSTSKKDITVAARALGDGKLVALPTETVYGLGADARNEHAIARIFEAKNRPEFDPLIIHVASPVDADEVADLSVPFARELADAFWPGPLTMVLHRKEWVPDLITSGLPTVAVRCPAHELARRILREAGIPVAAPSANVFGRLSPTTAQHVISGLGDRIDYVVDGGPCLLGVESTVVDLSMEPPLILRPGGISLEQLRVLVPTIELFDRSTTSPRAPGQLPSHYAPIRPLRLYEAGTLSAEAEKPGFPDGLSVAALCFGHKEAERLRSAAVFRSVIDLSPDSDVIEAAARLFGALHELELSACEEIWAERLPDRGLGRAVNDRLYKASVKPFLLSPKS
jgi:L-threonylcarbamoyladenylate synthase